METESRKRPAKGEEDGRKARVRIDGGGTATDAEVEEFFAILRRIHAAARYFGKGKTTRAGVSHKGVTDAKWRPTFEWEDFEGGMGLRSQEGSVLSDAARKAVGLESDGEARAKKTRLLGSLDLNTEPEPETQPS
ncbi:protein NEGATIVE REGULATOR OF RESISTANCE-like [Aristolochia californica]|uniref:protein NEGATIVE REGULATOR OF RESISTANCE-like n=1 Tax=Aristolochia californica TaxID=171875 RepID=UPI0035DF1249